MTLTKAHIAKTIHNSIGFTNARSAELVDSLLDTIKGTLENGEDENGEDVLISGFGRFCVKEKRKRRGRNPQTGEDLMLDARRVVTFRCSGVLRDKINGEGVGSGWKMKRLRH
jgi:integration host factor subunit alpha